MEFKSEWFDWNDKNFIESKIQDKPQQEENKILKYLKSGNPFMACASVIRDCFKPEVHIQTTAYTDTEWEWHDSLIYYVENYHYKISDEFLNHMKACNWRVSKLTEEEILMLCNKSSIKL